MTMQPEFAQIVALLGAGLTGIAAFCFTRTYQRREERRRATVAVRAHRGNAAAVAKRNP